MDIYREFILDHYKHPRNFGTLKKSNASAHAYNATCGDTITMTLYVQKGKVIDIRFTGVGCAVSMASASLLTEKIKHMDALAIMRLSTNDILGLLATDLTPSRIKCALLPLEVLQKALEKTK